MESFADYVNRVNSFTISKWPFRHLKLTPTKIARWGFVCLDQSTLQCNSCKEILSLKDFSLDIEDCKLKDTLYKKVISQLPSRHSEDCFFHGIEKNNSFLFKINREFFFQYALRQYEDNYLTIKDIKKVPKIKWDFLSISPEHQEYQIVFYDSPFDYEEKKINALKCYAIFGWRLNNLDGQNQIQENLLSCAYCGRTVKQQNFDEGGVHQIQSEGDNHFDLIEEHRYFCKWANNDPYSKKLYGYSILIQLLYHEYLQSNPQQLSTSKRNSMVQITVLRRELVTQLESLKKDQQQLTQELDNIEQENQGFIDRLGKRKRHNLDELIEDKEFHDQLQKKVKFQLEEILQKQLQIDEEKLKSLQNQKNQMEVTQESAIVAELVEELTQEFVLIGEEIQNLEKIDQHNQEERFNDSQSFKSPPSKDRFIEEDKINQIEQPDQAQIQVFKRDSQSSLNKSQKLQMEDHPIIEQKLEKSRSNIQIESHAEQIIEINEEIQEEIKIQEEIEIQEQIEIQEEIEEIEDQLDIEIQEENMENLGNQEQINSQKQQNYIKNTHQESFILVQGDDEIQEEQVDDHPLQNQIQNYQQEQELELEIDQELDNNQELNQFQSQQQNYQQELIPIQDQLFDQEQVQEQEQLQEQVQVYHQVQQKEQEQDQYNLEELNADQDQDLSENEKENLEIQEQEYQQDIEELQVQEQGQEANQGDISENQSQDIIEYKSNKLDSQSSNPNQNQQLIDVQQSDPVLIDEDIHLSKEINQDHQEDLQLQQNFIKSISAEDEQIQDLNVVDDVKESINKQNDAINEIVEIDDDDLNKDEGFMVLE